MSKHRKVKRSTRASALDYVGTGVGAAALVGVAVLLAIPTDEPAPATAEVQLASTDSLLVPLGPIEDAIWLFQNGGGSFIGGAANFSPNAVLAASDANGDFNIFRPIGTGGWLIGDGVDAAAGCNGSECNGGNAGILFGRGGDGADGGRGGDGGTFFGTGGIGGKGLDGQVGGAAATAACSSAAAAKADSAVTALQALQR